MLLYQHYITMTIYKIILWKSAKDDLIQSGFWFESLEFLDLSQREGIYWALNGLFWGGVHCWWLLFMILSQWLSIQRNKTGQWIYHFHVWMSSLYAFWNKETCQQRTALVATWPPRSIQRRAGPDQRATKLQKVKTTTNVVKQKGELGQRGSIS